jgi:two-component system cell cycle sensor histidine kinase/response regulator CckA
VSDPGGKATVLVVEDDPSLLYLIEVMLANAGFDLSTAGGAADGLLLVRERQGRFDLAILDMVMPGMSGLDLATELVREYPSIKILYISGYVGSLAADALARRTPDRVLLKPFTEQELLDRVRMVLASPAGCEPGKSPHRSAPVTGDGTVG